MKTKKALRSVVNASLILAILFIASIASTAQTVYITKTGKKYHTENCRYLRLSKYQISLQDAKTRGYEGCLVCSPPNEVTTPRRSTKPATTEKRVDSDTIENTKPSNEKSQKESMQQCGATTKSGARCKRMTASANGYCWQHQH